MKRKDQISGAFWLLVAGVTIQQSLELKIGNFHSPGPGYIPLMIGIGLAVVSVLIFLRATFFTGNQTLSLGVSRSALKKLGLVLAGLFLYAFLFPYLGFVASTFLFLILLLKGVEPQRWSATVLWSAGITLFAYLLFVVILRSEFPQGLLGI